MTPILVAALVFAALCLGHWLGMRMRDALPEHHLSPDSKEAVRLGMALISALTALVLGLVVAAAKSGFDQQDAAMRRAAADILTLDRVLADYGQQTDACRAAIKTLVDRQLDHVWAEGSGREEMDERSATRAIEAVDAALRALTPADDGERALQSRALGLAAGLEEARWQRLQSEGASIPTAFLVVVVFWLAVLFWSFGLFAPDNRTVRAVYAVCAFSCAAAVFLILELERPYDGIVKVSSGPMHYTAAHLGE